MYNPEPEMYNPEPEMYNPEPEMYNPEPDLSNPEPEMYNPESEMYNPEPELIVPESEMIVPESEMTVFESEMTVFESEMTVFESEMIVFESEMTVFESNTDFFICGFMLYSSIVYGLLRDGAVCSGLPIAPAPNAPCAGFLGAFLRAALRLRFLREFGGTSSPKPPTSATCAAPVRYQSAMRRRFWVVTKRANPLTARST
jgi:hypothetical protein